MLRAIEILLEKNQPMISVDINSSVYESIKIMNENKIGAILVKNNDEIVGIWTERDLLNNVLIDNFDIKTARIKDFMSTNLQSGRYDSSLYKLYDLFLGKRLRHLLIEKDDEYIGVLSQGDVVKASLNEKSKEIEDLNNILKWEYYENWRFNWKHKKDN